MTEKQDPSESVIKTEDSSSNSRTEGDLYQQKGKLGIGHVSDGEINGNVVGKIDQNHQVTINIYPSDPTNISKTSSNNNQNKRISFEIIISGELTEDKKAKYKDVKREIEDIVEKLSDLGIKHELITKYVEKGSIKIGLEGHPEDFKKLQELFESGELSEILGIPVEDIRLVVNEDLDNDKQIKNEEKSRLLAEIRNKGAVKRNLRGADLSDADLSGAYLIDAYLIDANLSGAYLINANLINANLIDAYLINAYLNDADLSGANLIRANLIRANLSDADLSDAYLNDADLSGANLSGANLSGAYLIRANLSDADLSGANLSGAYLIRANLSDADLSGAKVKKARFGFNRGISELLKQDLENQGAIFEDSPGDRSGVLV